MIWGDRLYDDLRVVAIALMEVQPRDIQQYKIPDGKIPFSEWLESLRDFKGKAKIVKRLERVSEGNLGDARSLGEGVWEFKIDFGPGYRVYFGQVETTIVLLLCGGDKSTQEQDISKAKKYWTEYRSRKNV